MEKNKARLLQTGSLIPMLIFYFTEIGNSSSQCVQTSSTTP